ncbi:MAG: cupin domain-containing protein [Nitrosopumilaceae archaeon]
MIKAPTNMKMVNVSILMEPNILFMKNIKKIQIDDDLEIDKTGLKKGSIYLKRLSKIFSTTEFKSYFIKFEKGSRSKIHLHDSDQIIIGMSGIGQVVIFSKINDEQESPILEIEESLTLNKGEAVLIPAGKLHWHGAVDNQNSAQLSFMKNGKTFWF